MRSAVTLLCAAALMQVAVAQTSGGTAKPQGQSTPATTGQSQSQGSQQQGSQQQGTQQAPSGAPAQGGLALPGQEAAPSKKSAPQAKTKEEYEAYQAAAASTDPNAADEFAQKFPTSDLRALLYVTMMRKFQAANDADHTVQMGRKAIALEPDNTMALVTTAAVLAERTHSTDLDKAERYAEATKDAQAAINTIDTGLVLPASVTPEQKEMVKNVLLSMAHGALGNVALEQNQYAEAEKQLSEAVTVNRSAQQDAVSYLRLAIAQDKQNKFPQAMTNVNKAAELAANDPQVLPMVQQEKTRLEQLSGTKK